MTKATHMLYSVAPTISPDDMRRFSDVVTIRDPAGFAFALKEFYLVKIQAAESKPKPGARDALRAQLEHKAAALDAEKTWMPTATDLQRGRAQMLKEFNTPNNLPLAKFAILANKSRQQVYKDVAARRLLALSVGTNGQRLPDWQLVPSSLELTREVLAKAVDVDEWTLFYALSEPLDALRGKSPVQAVNKSNMHRVVSTVLSALGVNAECP